VPVVEQKLAQAEHTLEVIQQEIDYASEQVSTTMPHCVVLGTRAGACACACAFILY